MPRYVYECSNCGNTLLTMHSFNEKLTDCEECETSGSLNKMIPTLTTHKRDSTRGDTRAGSLVDDKITEFKEDLRKEKERMKGTDFEPI